MSEPTNETPIDKYKLDYENEVYERERADSDYEFRRFCDYYGNNRRG